MAPQRTVMLRGRSKWVHAKQNKNKPFEVGPAMIHE